MGDMFKIFEDFYPINEKEAYITTGPDYMHQSLICKVNYSLIENKIIIDNNSSKKVIQGNHLRLGNIYDEKIIYSDWGNGIPLHPEINSPTAHQPFKTDFGILHSDLNKDTNLSDGIYLNGKIIISLWDDYKEMGNPCFHDGKIYFEARSLPAPIGWELWVYDMNSKEKYRIREHGANPYIYNNKLIYCKWIKGKGFEHYYEDI